MKSDASSESTAVVMGRRGSTFYIIDDEGLLMVAQAWSSLLVGLIIASIAVILLGILWGWIVAIALYLIFRWIINTAATTLREDRGARSGSSSLVRLVSVKEISWAELDSISVVRRKVAIEANNRRAKYRFSLNQSELGAAIELFRSKLGARVVITSKTASTATSSRSLRSRPAAWGVGLFASGSVLFVVGSSLIAGIPLDSVPIWDGVIIDVGALFVAASIPVTLIGELVRWRRNRGSHS
jgi:hypothetical protein